MKPVRITIALLWISFLCINLIGQTSYYISSIHGNDANTGTSAASPWKNISKLNSVLSNLQAGSTIYLERGSTWYEVDIKLYNRSGTSSNPITFTAYGTGPRPILSGGKKITGFSKSGNIYSASVLKDFPNGNIAVPTGILINGKWEDIARSSERFVMGSNSDIQLTDNSQNWIANELAGSYILVQPVKWHWSPGYITSNTSNTVYFNPINHAIVRDTYVAYYIANNDKYLQSPGDWTFKNRTLKVYYSTDLNNESVQFAYSDSVISLSNCAYINFQDIIFELANYRLLSVFNCNQIKATNCEFRYTAGEGVIFSDADNITFSSNYIHDCGAVGLRLYLIGPTEIKNNLFRRIATQQVGMANYDFRMGPAITIHCPVDDNPEIMYNYFDSVGLAIQGHTFGIGGSANISCNYIENYGVTISDCGAFYFASDMSSTTYKKIKKNIIRDAVTGGNGYLPYGDNATNPHPVLHPHAIYLDMEALGYLCDSNSIENTGIAFYLNRNYKNVFKNNNVVNADQYISPTYSSVYFKDQAIGLTNISADRDSVWSNNIVLSGTSTAGVYLRHTSMTVNPLGVDNNTFCFDYNRIASPFNSVPTIGKYVLHYGLTKNNYTLAQMQADGGNVASNPTDLHSVVNPQVVMYSNVSNLVSESNFVKFFTNFSKYTRTVNLGNATFRDMYGNLVSGSTTIPPFYSKILFYVSGDINTVGIENYIDVTLVPALSWNESSSNHAPVVQNTSFTVNETNPLPAYIGTVSAEDPDHAQGLTFSIISGNENNLFSINSAGSIYFTTTNIDFTGSPVYTLAIRVRDNGTPSLSSDATVTIRLVALQVNHSPVFNDQQIEFRIDPNTQFYVGSVIASDPDGNNLTYSFVSGNPGMFDLNSTTGELSFSLNEYTSNIPVVYELVIKVTDDGSPALSIDAGVEVSVIPPGNIVYIDPSATTNGDGTYESPYLSITGIQLESDHLYLFRRGTICTVDKVVFDTDDILLGSYGDGDKPVIQSGTYEYVFKSIDHAGIEIEDLHIIAQNAISCFYFLGPSCERISIKNSIIEGSDFGVRLINTKDVVVELTTISNTENGIFAMTEDIHISYNIFSHNQRGIEIVSNRYPSAVLNNVFYNNREAIRSSGVDIDILNNIFYLLKNNDDAIYSYTNDLYSNYNVFYPVTDNFITIGSSSYNTLDDVKQFAVLELNSMDSDPSFIEAGNDNFKLEDLSPAIDAGINVGLLVDNNGVPIPHGPAPDIGAYEIISSISPVNPREQCTIDVLIYPNPADNILTVRVGPIASSNYTIEILNLNGKIIDKKSVSNALKITHETSFNVNSLSSGIFLVRIVGENEMCVYKFIKN